MPRGKAVATVEDRTLARRQATLEAFAQLVEQVPDAEDGDIADLLGRIVDANTWEDLADDEAQDSSKTLVGKRLVVFSVAKQASDHQSITGYYLQVEGVVQETGEAVRFTAGGEHAVATLSKLHVLGALPAVVEFVQVGTRSGNDAINCKVHDTMSPNVVDA